MVRKNIIVLALLCVITYVAGMAGYANAAPATDPRCDTLSGAAYGMCLSAFAIGCDDPANTNPGCATIADKYFQVTGEIPVWNLPACPCGTAQDMIDYLAAGGGPGSCRDYVDSALGIYAATDYFYYVTASYPVVSNAKCTLGGVNSMLITPEEAQSCINEMTTVINQYNLTCTVFGTK